MTVTTPYKTRRWIAHSTPEVERLTPDRTADKCETAGESLDSGVAQGVASLLRLPVVLTELLNVSSELVNMETLDLFLSQRSISDRYQLLDLLEKLYQCCDNLCIKYQDKPKSNPTPNNEPESYGEEAPEYSCEVRGVNLESDIRTAASNHQPEDELENEFTEITPFPVEFEESMLDSDARSTYGNLRHNEFGDRDFVNPTAIQKEWNMPQYEIDGMFQSTSSAASSITENPAVKSAPVRETVERPSTSRKLPVTQLRTPLRTPSTRHSRITPEEDTSVGCDQPVGLIIEQSTTEFAKSSLEEIEQLRFPMDSAETYKDLLDSLKSTHQVQATWSNGSQWRSVVESGFAERHKSSIRYALTAIAFARWHRDQTGLLSLSSRTAEVQEVSSRILGPVPEDASEKKVRETRRKRLTTHLTRGRIWDELVTTLGFGILFQNSWSLAKSKKQVIQNLISQLQKDQAKMDILQLLEEQMDILIETGRTDAVAFKKALEGKVLLGISKQTSDISEEVISLQEEMRHSAPGNMLLIKSTGCRFGIETLDRLRGTEWFNDELVLLCLHLADRLPHVRVGFSIPIHQQDRPRKIVAKPFERAARVIEEWKNAEPDDRLTCFFPLFQHGDHFSLLEVNYRDSAVYHYDSLRKTTYTEIKKACKDQFPGLRYVEQTAPQQHDSFSCGPLVVASAYDRMLGRAVVPGNAMFQDTMTMKATALDIIRKAWRDQVLVPTEQSTRKKRRRNSLHQRQGKQRKLDESVQVEDLTT
ncbi:hypothetical protein F4678DRAFT_477486 [Xylaria arbuscula]|nr:hypothetical protein F4678DRAFT_477486 [Xylaria arbuscula]